jgi:hypothetical protein
MKTEKNNFVNKQELVAMSRLLEGWKDDAQHMKKAFLIIKDTLLGKKNTILRFKPRPGVSYSLRGYLSDPDDKQKHPPLFALVDIIDDDPANRWLSICFYTQMVTDPEAIGNLVPEGILGEDGYCFDLFEFDETLIAYIKQKIDEAYTFVRSL